MQGPGNYLFAGSALSFNHYGRVAARDTFDHNHDFLHGRARGDNVVKVGDTV